MATPVSRPVPASIGALPRVAAALYFLHLGVSVAIPAVLGWLTYRFLHRAEDTVPPFLAWLVALHPVVGRLWWLRLVLAVAAYGVFLAWLYVRYREAADRGAPTRYRPHWAITGALIPFLNFVRPYQVVNDAFRATAQLRQKETGNERPTAPPVIVKLWWGGLLITAAVGTFGGKSVFPGHMELDAILVSWHVGLALTSVLAIAVIAGLERERLGGEARLLGPLPTGIGSVAVAALSVSLALAGAYGLAMVEMGEVKRGEIGLSHIPPEVIPRGAVPPRPPSSWQVEGELAGGAIEVRWIGGGGQGYNVYRRAGDGTPVKLNAELVREPWFRDQEIEPSRTYLYSVSAVDRWGDESPRSEEATVATPPEAGSDAYGVSPTEIGGVPGGVPGGVAGGVPGGVVGGVVGGVGEVPPPPKTAPKQRIKLSSSEAQGNLVSRTAPAYPPLAKAARASGAVVLQVFIAPDGSVKNVRVLRGHPLLQQSAIDAVRKWRYRPYVRNGVAVEVETTVTMNFVL